MNRVKVDPTSESLQDLRIPFSISLLFSSDAAHETHLMATRNQLDAWIHELEAVSPLPGFFGIIGRFHISDLPWSPD
jgi:hypothetical protein